MQEKISSGVMYILIVISVVLFVLGIMGSGDPIEKHNYFDPILYGSYIYTIIGLLVAIAGAVYGIITNPTGLKEMGIGIVGMIVVLAAAYGLADGSDFVNYQTDTMSLSEGMSRFSGMLLYSIYILFGASVLTVAFSWIYSLTR